MRSIGKKLAPAICALALMAAVPAAAQAQVFLAGAGGISGFSGDDWDGVDAGFQLNGAIGTRLGDSFSLAGIFGWSTHGTDVTDMDLSSISIELQPAIRFGADGGTAFWVGARGGYMSVNDDDDATDSATGLAIGPVAGVGFPLSDRATLGVAGNWSILNLSSDDLTENLKGSKWGVGAYIMLGLGG